MKEMEQVSRGCRARGAARWIERIHDERVRAVRAKHPDKSEALVRTRTRLHVLVAAIRRGANVIVTFLKDFLEHTFAPYEIAVQHPNEFVDNLLHQKLAQTVKNLTSYRSVL